MKFVAPLTEAERLTLLEARDQGPTTALRRRAQAVELSSRGYRRTEIADLLEPVSELLRRRARKASTVIWRLEVS